MTSPRAVRTPSRDVEALLVEAADEVLRRGGLAAITVRAVAAQAKVAPMGLYSRFGSKDGLIDAVLIRAIENFRAYVRTRDPDPLIRLRTSGKRYREWALAHPAHYDAIFLARLGLGSPDVAQHSMETFGELLERVEFAMAAGAIRTEDVAVVGQMLWNSAHGAVSLELRGLVLAPDPAAAYELMLDTVLRGLRA